MQTVRSFYEALTGEEQPRSMLLLLSLLVLLLHVWVLMELTRPNEVQTAAQPLIMEVSLLAAPQQHAAAPAMPAPAPAPPPVKKIPAVKKPQFKPLPIPKKKPPVAEKKSEPPKDEPIAKAKLPEPSVSEAAAKSPALPSASAVNPAAAATSLQSKALPAKQEPMTKASIGATYGETPGKRYPAIAMRRGWEGTVLLKVQVSAEGVSEHVAVKNSSGHEILDEAAVEMVGKWKFIPAKRSDTPIASSVIVPIIFKLDN